MCKYANMQMCKCFVRHSPESYRSEGEALMCIIYLMFSIYSVYSIYLFYPVLHTYICLMDFSADIVSCLKSLRSGGTILYPTDTIWGIGCDATNPVAVQKIYRIKQREESKALIVLVADEKEVLKYVAQPDLRIFDYIKNAEKPTSVVYEGAKGLAENIVGKDGTVAIRIVRDEFCRHLIKRFRKPIVSTSANISGEVSPRIFSEVPGIIKKSVDLIVQYRQNDTKMSEPSVVIKWDKGKIAVIRP